MNRFELDDPEWISGILDGTSWGHGPVATAKPERIGEDYGLSGAVFRVTVTTNDGSASVIAKLEEQSKSIAAWNAWECAAIELGTSSPDHYGLELAGELGVIFMEDIAPATQGDDLVGCSERQVAEILDILVRLHETSRTAAQDADADAPRWSAKIAESGNWAASLRRAAARYPDDVTPELVRRLSSFPTEIGGSGTESPSRDATWIHLDPHLDNILWRNDGSPVLLDWSNARIGPPAVDIAGMLMGYAFRTDAPISPRELIRLYADRTASDPELLTREISHVLKPMFIQGTIGWVGEESNAGFPVRKETLRDDAARRLVRALDWVDGVAGQDGQ